MTPISTVLISLRAGAHRERLAGLVAGLGYASAVTTDGRQAVRWARERPFAASLLDSGMEVARGETVWRVVRRIVGRRLVLMVEEPRNDLWFEALSSGVAAVLPLPPEEPTVRAALRTALGGAGENLSQEGTLRCRRSSR